MNARSKLWSEKTPTEKTEEKEAFIASWIEETGCTYEYGAHQWNEYLNQEGWTGDDERILHLRDLEYEASLKAKTP